MTAVVNPFQFGVPFTYDAVTFDGSDMLYRTTNLTGAADSKTGILSMWLRYEGAGGAGKAISIITTGGQAPVDAQADAGVFAGVDSFRVRTSAGVAAVDISGNASSVAASGTWLHCLMAWDSSTGDASKTWYYVNGTDAIDTISVANQSVAWATNFATLGVMGSRNTGGINAPTVTWSMAEFYCAPGQWLDLSVAGNREKFRSAGGKPVYLGADGSTPTGSVPQIYLHVDQGEAAANIATNRAGKGDFTIAGTLSTASTRP